LTNRQIAERMFLAEKTVKNYVSRLFAKLGMERRTQAAVLATELRDQGHRPL
jgi:DNA-binding NarL/FixJ family response regulator